MTAVHEQSMSQTAPFPRVLRDLVQRLRYRAGWRFALTDIDRGQGSAGLTLVITTLGTNSYHPEQTDYRVNHYMIVPAAAYDERSWRRWLFDQLLLVESHEAAEFFAIADAGTPGHFVRPYAPNHGPGRNPYTIHEIGNIEDADTNFRGQRNNANSD